MYLFIKQRQKILGSSSPRSVLEYKKTEKLRRIA